MDSGRAECPRAESTLCTPETNGNGGLMDVVMSESSSYDPRFLQGIAYFNECDFFEAHEVWEDLWSEIQGPSRRFYQGLIQVAVCLHHFGNGNLRGAQKLYHSCR